MVRMLTSWDLALLEAAVKQYDAKGFSDIALEQLLDLLDKLTAATGGSLTP
jgi:hypothetical protein